MNSNVAPISVIRTNMEKLSENEINFGGYEDILKEHYNYISSFLLIINIEQKGLSLIFKE